MALGPQFKNTHWTDEQGNTQSYVLNTPGDPFTVTRMSGNASIPTQGMLFSPETGTGAKNDPLVPHERRIQAIKKGLSMDDPDKYAKRAGGSYKTNDKRGETLGPKSTANAIKAYTNALDSSNTSTYEIEKHLVPRPALAIANTDMTRGHIDRGRIRLPYTTTFEKIEVPETTKTVRTGVKLQPIANPNLSKQVEDVVWDSDQYVQDGVFEIADIVTPDGSPYDKTPHYETDDIPDFRAGHGKHNRGGEVHLPPGHHFNVWPGSGSNVTDPNIVVKTHKVYDGADYRGHESLRTFHTRHRIVGHESSHEEVVPARTVYKKHRNTIDQTSLIHELGHHLDPNLHDMFDQMSTQKWVKRRGRTVLADVGRPDPAQEGVADGRALVMSNDYLENTSRDMFEKGETGDLFSHYGYSTKFSGFANNTAKALYAAMVAHTAAHPRVEDMQQVPSRSSLYKQYYPEKLTDSRGGRPSMREQRDIGNDPKEQHKANVLLLGHMYDNHEHVRKSLDALGLGKAGMAAHKFYKDNDPKRYKGPEQTKLPGFE